MRGLLLLSKRLGDVLRRLAFVAFRQDEPPHGYSDLLALAFE